MELFTILIALSLGYLLALTISSVILTDGRGILEKLVDITNFGVIFSIIFCVADRWGAGIGLYNFRDYNFWHGIFGDLWRFV